MLSLACKDTFFHIITNFVFLVSHKSERQVIITLLELARLGYKYGLEPPSIIKIEKEIEQEQEEPPSEPLEPPKPKPPVSARSRPLNLDEEVWWIHWNLIIRWFIIRGFWI